MKSLIPIHINKADIPALKTLLAFDLTLIITATITFILTRSPWSFLILTPTLFPTFKITKKEEPSQ